MNKKVKYAIRMLNWHTKLAKRYHDIVKNGLDLNNINYNEILMNYIESNKARKDKDQVTIYDLI